MSLFGTGRREGILAVLVLVVLAVVQHAPGLFFGHPRAAVDIARAAPAELTRESATNDVLLAPAMRQAGAVVRLGSPPTWNPFTRLGEPFAASGANWLYPPFWLLALDGGRGLLDLLLCLHAALACVLAYRMLRTLSASRYSAFVAGGIYGLGWSMTVALDRLPEAAAIAWLPLVIDATWRCLFERRRARSAALLGIALAVMFTTGGTATAWLGATLVVTFLAVGLLAINRVDRSRALRAVGAGIGLCAAMTAPLWLHAWQYQDALATAATSAHGGIPAATLAGLFVPGLFHEMGAYGNAMRAGAEGADPITLALYPGAITLFVGLLGLLRPKRTRQSLYWLAIAGIGLVFAARGTVGDLPREVFGLLPYRPGAELVLFQLGACVLTALALENFFDAPRARLVAASVAAGLVLTISLAAVVTFLVVPHWGAGLLRSVLDLDGPAPARASSAVALAILTPAITGSLLAIVFLVWRRLGILRFKAAVAVIALGEVVVLSLVHVPRTDTSALDTTLAANLGSARVMRSGVDAPGSANAWSGTAGTRAIDTDGAAILARTRRLLDELEPDLVRMDGHSHVGSLRVAELLAPPFRQALAIGTLIGPDAPDGFEPDLATPSGAGAANPMRHTARAPTARARIAFRIAKANSPKQAAARMTSPERRATDAVVLEGDLGEFVPLRPATEPNIEWMIDRPDHVALSVDMTDGRGWLVLADAFAPGWYCTVDGEPTPIRAADVAIRAVPLREGRHEVVFRFAPLAMRLGVPLAAAGLVLALGALLWSWRRR